MVFFAIQNQWRIQDYELGGGRDWYTQAEGLCDEAAGFAGGGMGGVSPLDG